MAGAAFAFFCIHSLLYVALLLIRPDFIEGTFFEAGYFFFSFRWLDPTLWFFWFFGFLWIKQTGLFLTVRYFFLITVSVVLYGASIIPALIFGFSTGFPLIILMMLLASVAVFLGKRK